MKSKYSIHTYSRRGCPSQRPIKRFMDKDEMIKWLKDEHPNILIGTSLGYFTIYGYDEVDPYFRKNINQSIRKCLNTKQ